VFNFVLNNGQFCRIAELEGC